MKIQEEEMFNLTIIAIKKKYLFPNAIILNITKNIKNNLRNFKIKKMKKKMKKQNKK
jgi:hypothetical protein